MTEKEEKEKEGEGVTENPVGEGESSPEEEYDKRLQYAYSVIRRELPGVEVEEDEFEGALYIWVPYRAIEYNNDDEEDVVDRALRVGTVYLFREDPQTHRYFLKNEEEINENVKWVKHDFLFKEEQICSIVNQLLQINEANKQ